MPDGGSGWLVEEGIAEHRAVRLVGDRIIAARVEWPGQLAAGWIVEAKLAARTSGSARGTAVATSGEEVLVNRLPRDAREGATLRLAITRAALHGPGRFKRAQGRPTTAELGEPTLAERLDAQVVRRFRGDGWDELIDEALTGEVAFGGGALLFAATPALTAVDIDGGLAPRALALAAVSPLSQALRRFDLGGSIAIDFPTLPDKSERRAIDEALAGALDDWPHERTGLNGFGLAQIVARLERPSLLHLAAWRRDALVWRRLLRRAETLSGPGSIELAINPALESVVAATHLAALERRTGKRVQLRKVATTALEAPHAQCVEND